MAKRGLENFCQKVWEAQNLYCRYYSGNLNSDFERNIVLAKKNLKYFNKIILFENLTRKLSIHKNKKSYPDITELEKKIIKRYNEFDIEIYKFTKNISTPNSYY